MEWWETLLMTAGSCLVTLVVTFLFNWFVNKPKKAKEEREKYLKSIREEVMRSVQQVHDEAAKQSDECKKDHKCLTKIIADIQLAIKAENKGLQAVLKDLLKIRYMEWIRLGYAPMDAREDLERMYKAYHGLGANGVMDKLREEFLELPVDKR